MSEQHTQITIDDAKLVAIDPEVRRAVDKPTVTNVLAAAQDPSIAALIKSGTVTVSETKAGYKTTEFWLTLAGLAALNLNGVVLTLPDKWQAVGSAVIAGLYALSRGVAKSNVPAVEATPVSIAPAAEITQR